MEEDARSKPTTELLLAVLSFKMFPSESMRRKPSPLLLAVFPWMVFPEEDKRMMPLKKFVTLQFLTVTPVVLKRVMPLNGEGSSGGSVDGVAGAVQSDAVGAYGDETIVVLGEGSVRRYVEGAGGCTHGRRYR